MKLSKRAQANRRNARRSTGPRSTSGKKKVARNARRHDFAVPISDIPAMSAKAEQLANLIGGSNADGECLDLARRIADAQIDLIRVRTARMAIIDMAVINPRRLQDASNKRLQNFQDAHNKRIQIFQEKMRQVYEAHGAPIRIDRREKHDSKPIPNGTNQVEREASALVDVSGDLTRLERYERRAFSRRKTAIRELDFAGI